MAMLKMFQIATQISAQLRPGNHMHVRVCGNVRFTNVSSWICDTESLPWSQYQNINNLLKWYFSKKFKTLSANFKFCLTPNMLLCCIIYSSNILFLNYDIQKELTIYWYFGTAMVFLHCWYNHFVCCMTRESMPQVYSRGGIPVTVTIVIISSIMY